MSAPDDIPSRKRDLRARLRVSRRARIAAPDAPERRSADAARIAAHFLEHAPADLLGRGVASYEALPTEPPTDVLATELIGRGLRVLVPLLLDDLDLEWCALGPDGRHGPPLGREAIAGVGVVLTPALSVDTAGRRLGQGGGSYDRALARRTALATAPGMVVSAVYDEEFITGPLPVDAHDARVDAALTPNRGWTPTGRSPNG